MSKYRIVQNRRGYYIPQVKEFFWWRRLSGEPIAVKESALEWIISDSFREFPVWTSEDGWVKGDENES